MSDSEGRCDLNTSVYSAVALCLPVVFPLATVGMDFFFPNVMRNLVKFTKKIGLTVEKIMTKSCIQMVVL